MDPITERLGAVLVPHIFTFLTPEKVLSSCRRACRSWKAHTGSPAAYATLPLQLGPQASALSRSPLQTLEILERLHPLFRHLRGEVRSSEITLPLLRAAGVTGMYLEFYVAPSDRNIGDLLIQFDRLRDIDVQVQWGLWGVTAVRSFLRVLRDSLPCLERATVPIPINCDLGADHVCVSGEDVAVLCALREGRSIELHGVLIFAPREALSDPQCARILATLLTSSETIATPWSQLSWWGPSNNMEAWVVWSHLTPGACGRKDCYRVEPSRDRVRTVKAPAVFIAEWIDISRFDTEWPILGPRVTELVWTGGYLEALLSVNVKLIDAADQQRVPAEGQVAFSAPDLLVRIITCAPDSYNAAAIHRRLVALHIFLPSARLAIVSGTPSRIRG